MKLKTIFASALMSLIVVACGSGSKQESSDSIALQEDQTAFMESQPVENGQYRAVSYDITGKNARKGKYDGRVMFYLSPEQSGFYVYENGNRAKIDYKVGLKTPFEKGDSGVYKALDTKDLPVTIVPDSALYVLTFEKNDHKVSINFEQTPMSTATAVEMMEKISGQIKKNKQQQ